MHGSTAGLESADPSSTDDPVRVLRDALTLFNKTAKEACDLSEHKLQREAEDAAARCISRIEALEADFAARERQRSSEAVHGEDPKAAEVTGDSQAVPFADLQPT